MTKFLAIIVYVLLNSDGTVTPKMDTKLHPTDKACQVETAKQADQLSLDTNKIVLLAVCGPAQVIEAKK